MPPFTVKPYIVRVEKVTNCGADVANANFVLENVTTGGTVSQRSSDQANSNITINLADCSGVDWSVGNSIKITATKGSFSESTTHTIISDEFAWDAGILDCTAWYDASWTKRKKITLTGTTPGAQTDFQIKLIVVHDGDMQLDFDDLRFTQSNGTTLIDAWLESKTDSVTADIWVEFPTTPANMVEQTYYMYYGNSGASSAWDGANTFLEYSDGADEANWTNTVDNVSGELHFHWGGTSAATKTINVAVPYTIEMKFRSESVSNQTVCLFVGDGSGTGFPTNRNIQTCQDGNNSNVLYTCVPSAGTLYNSMALSTYYILKETQVGASDYDHYLYDANRSLLGSVLNTTYGYNGQVDPITGLQLGSSSGAWNINTYVSWVFIHKYVANPATYLFGSEEDLPTAGGRYIHRIAGIFGMQYTGRRSW